MKAGNGSKGRQQIDMKVLTKKHQASDQEMRLKFSEGRAERTRTCVRQMKE